MRIDILTVVPELLVSPLNESILGKILPLGDEVTIYPGHGEKSNIGHESLYNPFVVEVLNNEVDLN